MLIQVLMTHQYDDILILLSNADIGIDDTQVLLSIYTADGNIDDILVLLSTADIGIDDTLILLSMIYC